MKEKYKSDTGKYKIFWRIGFTITAVLFLLLIAVLFPDFKFFNWMFNWTGAGTSNDE